MKVDDIYKEFIGTIREENIKERINEYELNDSTSEDNCKKMICDAIWLGYLDACRTFSSGSGGKIKNTIEKEDERIKRTLPEKIYIYLKEGNVNEYDTIQKEFCDILIRKKEMYYGQAQKIVNMTFKYLYCCLKPCDSSNSLVKKFDKCHMPLDGIMLEWIYRTEKQNKKQIIKEKIPSWSRMEYGGADNEYEKDGKYTYKFFLSRIKEYCTDQISPLKIDFENWSKMSLVLASEVFLNALGENEFRKWQTEPGELIDCVEEAVMKYKKEQL